MGLSDVWARRLLDGLPTFACLLTPEGALIAANHAALEAANLKPQVVLGRRFEDTYWWSYSAAIQQELRQAIRRAADGVTVRYEVFARVADARFICLDLSIAPIPDDHGVVRYLISSGADITHQRTTQETHRDREGFLNSIVNTTPVLLFEQAEVAEEAVRQSEQRFRALRDANIIGIIYTNFDGRIIEANDAFLRLLGFTREDLRAGRIDWRKLTPAEWQERDVEALTELQSTGRATPWEKEYYRKDGRRAPVLVGASLMNDQTRDVMAFILDISERKKLEQRKDDFIALASHELKTPITTLKTYTQALRRRFEDSGDESTVRLVARMETQINRLVEVVQDLLDVSKIRDGKLSLNVSPFVMDDLVRELVAEMQPITAHELRVEAEAGETILADRERIRQVLINLLFNAVTYSPKTEPILVRSWRDAGGTHVSVVDHGVGIPQSEQARIFDRFYQIDSSSGKTYPGLGLGLFISAEIMKRHRGQLSVESEVGQGSTFTLTLPDSATRQGEPADE